MRRVRLVIADRRPIVLHGLVSLLEAQPDFEVVACCLDGAGCLAAIRRLAPDVVLLEDGFTDVTASDILAVVDDEDISSRLVFFTATVSCADLARALAAGACGAISMHAKPEALVQSLRLEQPGSDLARVGNEANDHASFGNNVFAVLTVNEWTIMELVAEGLSDREISRALGVSLEIVRIHIDHARKKLGINSRNELAALALSRRHGAMSILAAAILAALDDTPGQAASDSLTVMTANGSAEVVSTKISRKETVSDDTRARGASKDRAGPATGTSAPASKLLDPLAEISASLFAQAALNPPRAGSSSYSIFMVSAFAALIYELDGASNAAQAFDFNGQVVSSSSTSDAGGLASALTGFENFGGATFHNEAFLFEFAKGDTIATDSSELHVGVAHAEDGGGDRKTILSSGCVTVDVAAAEKAASPGDPMQTGQESDSNEGQSHANLRASDNGSEIVKHGDAVSDLNHGQSQKILEVSDDGSGAAKGHAKPEAMGEDQNYGQSQKVLKVSDDGSVTAKGHAKPETMGDDLNHGQSQKILNVADDSSGAAKGYAKHEAIGDDLNHGQSQKVLKVTDDGYGAARAQANHEATGHDSNRGNTHGDLQAFENGSAAGKQHTQHLNAGKAEPSFAELAKSALGNELSDSFHFKNGADSMSSAMYDLQQLSDSHEKAIGNGPHAVLREVAELSHDVGGTNLVEARHDYSGYIDLHAAHDFIL